MTDIQLAIVGGGVAGLTAGLYAAREGLDVTLFDRMGPGGQLNNVGQVDNFPGFPGGVTGPELGPRCAEQAMDAGVRIEFGEILSLRPDGDDWRLETDSGKLTARAVIIAVGSSLRRLGVEGEERLEGRGVSYCATCDGEFFRDQDVAVVGGGDSALDEALHLTEMARSITLIYRGDELHGAHVTQQRLLTHEHVRVLSGRTVRELYGEDQLEAITVGPAEGADGAAERIEVAGIFIFAGLIPNTAILADLVPLDAAGHVSVDWSMATERPGLYAVGDIRQHSSRQLVSAAGDGATAALAVRQYLRRPLSQLSQRSSGDD